MTCIANFIPHFSIFSTWIYGTGYLEGKKRWNIRKLSKYVWGAGEEIWVGWGLGGGGGNQSRNQNLIISYNIMYELIKSENVPPPPPRPSCLLRSCTVVYVWSVYTGVKPIFILIGNLQFKEATFKMRLKYTAKYIFKIHSWVTIVSSSLRIVIRWRIPSCYSYLVTKLAFFKYALKLSNFPRVEWPNGLLFSALVVKSSVRIPHMGIFFLADFCTPYTMMWYLSTFSVHH